MKQTKRSTPYDGDDIKDFVHDNKFHTTASHAFKDAKYAEWFEKDPEMSDMKMFFTELAFYGLPILAGAVLVVCIVFKIVSST